jgi:coenzyme F420-0:L-glutamate ligase/coenzyme F420-1:gamma-L-glutamate ligase
MIQLTALTEIPEINVGDNISKIIVAALSRQKIKLIPNDLLVIAQKIVSKSEGRLVNLKEILPSQKAIQLARKSGHTPQHMEVILQEATKVLRCENGVVITKTRHGFICANSGIDTSNVPGESTVCLLPIDPDLSAKKIGLGIAHSTNVNVPVIICDTFGRPWRRGAINLAIGSWGINPLKDYRGEPDSEGIPLKSTQIAVADELACAAELVMNKVDRVPAVLVRGYLYKDRKGCISESMLREEGEDLFL